MADTLLASSFEEFTGVPVNLYVQQALTDYPQLENSAKLSLVKSTIDVMVATLTAWCIAGQIPSRSEYETIRWPDGPWQAFKDKYGPRWLLRYFPIKYHEEQIEIATHHYFVCPHLVTTDHREHIRFMATGTRMASRI